MKKKEDDINPSFGPSESVKKDHDSISIFDIA